MKNRIMFMVFFGNLIKSSGIINKIYAQSKAMHDNNIHYKTYIFCRSDDYENKSAFKEVQYIEFVSVDYYGDNTTFFSRLSYIRNTYKLMKKMCKKEKEHYDYLYMRYSPEMPWYISLARYNRGRFIAEHNSEEIKEYIANKRKKHIIQARLFGKLVRKYVKYYVCVSEAVYEHQKELYAHTKARGIIISNGVDVNKNPLRKPPKFDHKNINLLFIGNIRYWHGLDRLVKGLSLYKGDYKFKIDIIGPYNQEQNEENELVKKLGLTKNIVFHGYKSSEESAPFFNTAHAAIGCLATARKGMYRATTLKNREYASRGIPIITAEYDEDLTAPLENKYYFMVPNDETPIDFEFISSVIEKIYKENPQTVAETIRSFAVENLTYEKKYIKLLNLLNEKK